MSYPPLHFSVLALDPGQTTGAAIGRVTVQDNLLADIELVLSTEVEWGRRFDGLEYLMNFIPYNVVVVEDFRLYKTKATAQINSRFPSSQLIGVIEYLAWERNYPVVFQLAAVRNRVKVPTEVMANLGGQTRGGKPANQHRYDSYQHLRYYSATMAAKLWQIHILTSKGDS
jgi:hypothetical protein